MTQQQFEQAVKLQRQIGDHQKHISLLAELREAFLHNETSDISYPSEKVWRALEGITKDEAATVLSLLESLHDGHKAAREKEFANL